MLNDLKSSVKTALNELLNARSAGSIDLALRHQFIAAHEMAERIAQLGGIY
ncbi:hypothetical protein [Methylocapsa acidiphila]|uniref:hypothetical protein n=1 Tax=Methylocapsa acidiphila TaxID=133552 RepID=UPI00041171B8|nr:hypothetical protein [Methylocapsa acidiphila]